MRQVCAARPSPLRATEARHGIAQPLWLQAGRPPPAAGKALECIRSPPCYTYGARTCCPTEDHFGSRDASINIHPRCITRGISGDSVGLVRLFKLSTRTPHSE